MDTQPAPPIPKPRSVKNIQKTPVPLPRKLVNNTNTDLDSIKEHVEICQKDADQVTQTNTNSLNSSECSRNSSVSSPDPNEAPPSYQESLYDQPTHSNNSSVYFDTVSSLSLERLKQLNSERAEYIDTSRLNRYIEDKNSRNGYKASRSDSWTYFDADESALPLPSKTDESESIYANEVDIIKLRKHKYSSSILQRLTPENLQRISALSSISVPNSLYENHILQPIKVNRYSENKEPTTSHSKKFDNSIVEFDPLSQKDHCTGIDDLSVLENILQGDTYSNSTAESEDKWAKFNDDDIMIQDIIPPPPTRFDSLPTPEATPIVEKLPDVVVNVSQSTFFQPLPSQSAVQSSDSSSCDKKIADEKNEVAEESMNKTERMKQRISGLFSKFLPDNARSSLTTKLSFRNKSDEPRTLLVPRNKINVNTLVTFQGPMLKIGRTGGVDDFFGSINPRWCHLTDGKLFCYLDDTTKVLKETIPIQNILSAQLVKHTKLLPHYSKATPQSECSDDEYHCYELLISVKGLRNRHIFGLRYKSDRRQWMQKVIESQTDVFPANLTSNFIMAGWVYMKEGVSGRWTVAWLMLQSRTLFYKQTSDDLKSVDLRKARCIALRDVDPDTPVTDDEGPQLLLDCAVGGTLYIKAQLGRCTCSWKNAIKAAAHNNGASLDSKQLTKNNVPVLVDKCVNFVYTHGSMSEGIYRRSGSGKVVNEILTKFNQDAWAVQLTKDLCSEHDVACVLKRFMRDLPETVLTNSLHPYFCKITALKTTDEKIKMYKELIAQLPRVSYQTLKCLMTHLHFIQSQQAINQMSIKNLATLWGPTLLKTENREYGQWSQNEINVISDLISLKEKLWPSTADESAREHKMLSVLLNHNKSSSEQCIASIVSSGDFRVWVSLHTPSSKESYNISLNPNKTASDICRELSPKIKIEPHLLCLEEWVLNGQLHRPIHHTEKVLECVLRWSYWDQNDCKDNCLVLKSNALLREIETESSWPVAAVSGELKYADSRSKNFKHVIFEFSQAKLSYYKDKNCSIKLSEWNIEDILWYIGHEPKRDPHSRWCITFISRSDPPNRTKLSPWFGHAIAGTDHTQQLKWLAALSYGEHPKGLLTPPLHVNLIDPE